MARCEQEIIGPYREPVGSGGTARPISLAQARDQALADLAAAEQRRRDAAESEACWAAFLDGDESE